MLLKGLDPLGLILRWFLPIVSRVYLAHMGYNV